MFDYEPTPLPVEPRTTSTPWLHRELLLQPLKLNQIFNDAVRNSDLTLLEKMVTNFGVNVNIFDAEGQTALTRGCYEGNLKMVKFLVGLGADVKLANRFGWSCLHIAAFMGNLKLMTFLLRALKEQARRYYAEPETNVDNNDVVDDVDVHHHRVDDVIMVPVAVAAAADSGDNNNRNDGVVDDVVNHHHDGQDDVIMRSDGGLERCLTPPPES